ncbi:hypothetical protein F5X98DRAFT_383817 [Xylaria grammica]|nr:hypothetical protein F5X98DRAFT_383817 [Xylaria grammica]
MPNTRKTCSGETKAGEPCRAAPMTGHSFCRHHLPKPNPGQSEPPLLEPPQKALAIRSHAPASHNPEDSSDDSEDTISSSPEVEKPGKETGKEFSSHDHSSQYNAQHGGRQSNNTGSGNQFPSARFHGNVSFRSTTNNNNNGHYGDIINNSAVHVNNVTEAKQEKQPETPREYRIYITNFTSNNLSGFVFDYEELAKKAADLTNGANNNFDLDPKFAPGVVKLDVFDFMILCDNSRSMMLRPALLKSTLKRLAKIANILTPTGISLRFLNYDKDGNGDFDGLFMEDVERKFKEVGFKTGSRLGTVLRDKIVEPIIAKAQSRTLEKPVLVLIITDGKPSGENPDTLRDAIHSCKQSADIQYYGSAAVVFIVARLGSSTSAKRFLGEIENDEAIQGMVYCSADGLNRQDALPLSGDATSPPGGGERENTTRVIELLLAALPE